MQIRQDIPDVDYSSIIQQLIRMDVMTTVQGADLLIQCSDLELEEEEEEDEEEDEEEEYDLFDIPNHVRGLELDHSVALRWLTRLCQDAVENREEQVDYDTVFLVPKCEEHHEALRDGTFKDLLKCLGAVPPLSAYETYWKITSDISDNVLRKGLSLLKGEDDGDSTDLDDVDMSSYNRPVEEDEEEEGDMDDFFAKLRNQKPTDNEAEVFVGGKSRDHYKSRDQTESRDIGSRDISDTSDKENEVSVVSSNTKRTLDDSDSDSEMGMVSQTKKKRTVMLEFSDSD